MLNEILRFEFGLATIVTVATVTLPSIALACLLTLWVGRRVRPAMLTTLEIAAAAALPWALWLTMLMLVADGARSPLLSLPVMGATTCAGLIGSVPAALFTRHAAVMPRGRRAEDK